MRTGRAGTLAIVGAALLVGAPAALAGPPLTTYVETRMGTEEGSPDFGTGGGAGATYPGAVAPFGMVQLSPDTDPGIGNYSGGYTASDRHIKGFSLTHVSGAGCSNLGDVPMLPTTQAVTQSPSTLASYDVNPRYIASFTPDGEVAKPGDYRVRLNPGAQEIRTELTASQRSGAMRMTFPTGSRGSVLFNAGGSSMGNFDASLHVDPVRREISGTVSSGAFCSASNRYRIYFVARFDRAFTGSGTWQKAMLQPGGRDVTDRAIATQVGPITLQYKRTVGLPDSLPGHPTQGAQAGAYATFDTREDRAVVARVAVSSVSVSGARANLDASAPTGESFDVTRRAAKRAWERQLSAIRVGGGTTEQRRVFYTSLYHSLVMPNVFSDVDGRYRGMDGQIHRALGYTKYANISGWDTYRSQLPLMAMLAPRAAADFVSGMLADYRESGHLPKWALLEGQTNVMVGDPADLLIAGAHAFGARAFDAKAALAAMVDGATNPGVSANAGYVQRAGLTDYLKQGYVGFERNTSTIGQTVAPSLAWGTASTTLEYATADFGIARLAAALGDGATCQTFMRRAGNWRTQLDPGRRLMQPRRSDGGFVKVPPDGEDGFVEGSAEQYTWAVPQDVGGLVDALGGRDVARARLDTFFKELNGGVHSAHAFLGNEPTLHTPYLYDWVGAPGRGAAAVRRALLGLYKSTPGGFPGNDDGGSMSSWVVFAALGFYPAVPGTDTLAIGSPLFPRATIALPNGRTVTITAPQAAADRPYVRRAWLGGQRLSRAWVRWRELAGGHRALRFDLTGTDGQSWATGIGAAPPSYTPQAGCAAR